MSKRKVAYDLLGSKFLSPVGWLNKLLTVPEVAELIGVRPSTIYQWTHQGFIPYVKIGKLVRFKPDAVMKWINETEKKGRKERKYEVRDLGP